jgi:hypothetical protein
MSKLINLIVAGVVFWAIYFYLVPLLPEPARAFIGVIVVVIAIVYLLGELAGQWPAWPWNKP